MMGTASISMRPVTVAPSRIAGGGSVKPILTSKVLVCRIGLGRDLADAPVRDHPGIVRQAYGDLRIARRGADHLSRHVEHRVAPVLGAQV